MLKKTAFKNSSIRDILTLRFVRRQPPFLGVNKRISANCLARHLRSYALLPARKVQAALRRCCEFVAAVNASAVNARHERAKKSQKTMALAGNVVEWVRAPFRVTITVGSNLPIDRRC